MILSYYTTTNNNNDLSSSKFWYANRQREKERRWKAEQIPRPCQGDEKALEDEGDSDINHRRDP